MVQLFYFLGCVLLTLQSIQKVPRLCLSLLGFRLSSFTRSSSFVVHLQKTIGRKSSHQQPSDHLHIINLVSGNPFQIYLIQPQVFWLHFCLLIQHIVELLSELLKVMWVVTFCLIEWWPCSASQVWMVNTDFSWQKRYHACLDDEWYISI